MGYILVFCSLLSYGLLGICHKLGERMHCRPKLLAMMLFVFGAMSMNFIILLNGARYSAPRQVVILAVVCGIISFSAIWAFQIGIEYGKIATSWLIINLSSVIPTIGSIIFYHEQMSTRKIWSIVMIFAAIVLVWKDGLEDMRKLEEELKNGSVSSAQKCKI